MMIKKLISGMTLLELMAVIAILGILASIAYPSYFKYVTRAHRAEAATALMNVAAQMEKYNQQNHTYAKAAISQTQTPHGLYQLSIREQTPTTFIVQAIPNSTQAKNDPQCGTLSLNQAGVKEITGNGNVNQCW